MTIAQQLADFVSQAREVPPGTRATAVNAVLDLTTAAAAGHHTPGARTAAEAAAVTWGSGPAAVWFSPRRLTVPGAAFTNAAAASMLDLDDGHRAAAGHPGACIVPAALATAAAYGGDADSVLTAIALGYEIAVRVSAARGLERLDTLVSGPWCGQGAAAAAGWLRRLPPDRIAQALAIAGASAPNLAAIAYSRVMGNHVKEGIPWATATGLAAVDLAAAGSTGPLDLWDNGTLYDPDQLTGGLGETWRIDGIYFKPYSCCRWAHAAIDALASLQLEHAISAAEIKSMEVRTFRRTLTLNNDVRPSNLEAAQYSVPFCLALAAVRGTDALLPLTEAALADDDVLDLAHRVRLKIDPALDAMFPAAVPARLELTTASGRLARTVTHPKGEATNPMTRGDLEAKFEAATDGLIDRATGAALSAGIERLDGGELEPLLAALTQPLQQTDSTQVAGLAVQNA